VTFWTAERVEWVKAGWVAGDGQSEMARSAGTSRNVIIGKIRRLIAAGELEARPDGRPTRSRPAPSPARPPRKAPKLPETPVEAPEPEFDPEIARTLEDLGKNSCHWPIGDPTSPGFLYCGQPGAPYCPGHARMVHQPKLNKPRRGGRPRIWGNDDALSESAD
jgi:GcrA cell cycle regulator